MIVIRQAHLTGGMLPLKLHSLPLFIFELHYNYRVTSVCNSSEFSNVKPIETLLAKYRLYTIIIHRTKPPQCCDVILIMYYPMLASESGRSPPKSFAFAKRVLAGKRPIFG